LQDTQGVPLWKGRARSPSAAGLAGGNSKSWPPVSGSSSLPSSDASSDVASPWAASAVVRSAALSGASLLELLVQVASKAPDGGFDLGGEPLAELAGLGGLDAVDLD